MKIGKVVGNLWATKKDENLNGHKLLILKIINSKNKIQEDLIVASDIVGAGIGELVLISHGSGARYALGNHNCPIDAAVVGIVDSLDIDESI